MNNIFKITLLLSLLTILLVVMGSAVGGQWGMIVAFLIAAAMNLSSYWFSDKIILRMNNAHQVSREKYPVFYGMIDRLAAQARLPIPKICIIPDGSPNVFATGQNPDNATVAATEVALRIPTPVELEAVMRRINLSTLTTGQYCSDSPHRRKPCLTPENFLTGNRNHPKGRKRKQSSCRISFHCASTMMKRERWKS